jgi:uncharacterized protein involved in exopolysaccharide biosynthesis/Mrp family chromosome partitioning ATPase
MELRLYWEILRRRWIALVAALVLLPALTLLATVVASPVYKSTARLWVRVSNAQQKFIKGLPTDIGKYEFTSQDNAMGTIEEWLKSGATNEPVIRRLGLVDGKGRGLTAERFVNPNKLSLVFSQHRGLAIEHLKDSEVFELTGYAPSQEQARDIVREVAGEYLKSFHEMYRADAAAARRLLETSYADILARLDERNLALAAFRKEQRVYDESSQVTTALSELSSLESELQKAERTLREDRAGLESIRGAAAASAEGFRAAEVLLEDSATIQQYKQSIVGIETDLAKQRVELTDEHPEVKALLEQADVLREALRAEVRRSFASQILGRSTYFDDLATKYSTFMVDLVSQRVRAESLAAQVATKRGELAAVPGREKGYNDLVREIDNLKSMETSLYSSLELAKIAERMDLANSFTFEPAGLAENPRDALYFPRRKKALLVAFVVAALLGAFFAFLWEYVDDAVWTAAAAEGASGRRLLGLVPKGRAGELDPRGPPRGRLAGGVDGVVAALRLHGSGSRGVVVLASPAPRAGTSLLAAHAAVAIARRGARVLLVDADLRRPRQHVLFGVEPGTGLAGYLAAEAAEPAIVATAVAGVDLLPAGSPALEATPALLDTDRFTALLARLATLYDTVVVDTPPLSAGSEAPTVGRLAAAVVLVAAQGRTAAGGLRRLASACEAAGAPVAGVALTRVRLPA